MCRFSVLIALFAGVAQLDPVAWALQNAPEAAKKQIDAAGAKEAPATQFLSSARHVSHMSTPNAKQALPKASPKLQAVAAKSPPVAQGSQDNAVVTLKEVIQKMQAINVTLGQLEDIVNETNATLNKVVDQVLEGTGTALAALDALKTAAKSAGQFGMKSAAEAVSNFADQLVAVILNFQEQCTSMREQVQSNIDKEVSDFLALRDEIVNSFGVAMDKVAELDGVEVPPSLLQMDQAFWPFDAIFGKKKSAVDTAETAILKANETVEKVSQYLRVVNASNIELMTGLVMGTVQSVIAQFEEKCQAAIDAQGSDMPEVLGKQASNICTTPTALLNRLTPIVDVYKQLLQDKIVVAQQSIQPLFAATEQLMSMVEDAKAVKEAADNATASR